MKRILQRSILILAAVAIPFIQFGCSNGLTRCLWAHSQMEVSRMGRIGNYHVSSNNNNKLYLEWNSLNNERHIVEVDISNMSDISRRSLAADIALYRRMNKKPDVLAVHDYSSVPKGLRKYYRYTRLEPAEVDLTETADIEIRSMYFSKIKPAVLEALPRDAVLSVNEYVPDVELIEYAVNERSILATAARVIATPFTLVADVIVVPAMYVHFYLTWKGP